MQQVLLITDINFWVKGAGHRMRIYNLIEYLVNHVQLTVLFLGEDTRDTLAMPDWMLQIDFITVRNIGNAAMEETGAYVSDLLKDRNFDAVIVEYIHNTYLLKYLKLDNVTTILDAHDLISERTEQFKKFNYQGPLYEMSDEFEFHVFDIYDYVMVLCEPDWEKINNRFDYQKALLCPYSSSTYRHAIRPDVLNIGFIASEYYPNIDAIHFFIKNCWPSVIEKYNVTLTIYGNICRKINATGKGLDLRGFVADPNDIYKEVDIIINPVRFGAGLKIKNIEAMAHGKPLLTTSHGARGLEKEKGKAFLTADEPKEFITALSLLIQDKDLRIRLTNNAHDFINQNFSADRSFAQLLEVINCSA